MRFLFSSLHYLHIGWVKVTLSHGRIPLLRTLLALWYRFTTIAFAYVFLSWQVIWLNALILFSFLMKSKKDLELRKWAAEGLSFLTMEADVKVHPESNSICPSGAQERIEKHKQYQSLSQTLFATIFLTVPVVRPVIETGSFPRKSVGTNASVGRRAISAHSHARTSRSRSRSCAHLLCVLPHGFSRKREIARSLKVITFLLSEH